MPGNIFDKILGREEDLDKETEGIDKDIETDKEKQRTNFLILFLIFLLAIVPRLVYMFFLSNPDFPGWYTDVFHHWQIAYLSKEIGFSHGFLRLWDFKGMEFFWGLLHPLVLVGLFYLTGSISIIIPRLLAVIGGSISIVLLFILIKKYFNSQTAWASVIFATFFPITLFSNTVGMQEELGMPFILGSILLWESAPVLAGVFLAFASMVRAEYWLFAAGLVTASFFLKRQRHKSLMVFITYIIVIAIYMKYLANYTGNYIYPIYWNFLANIKGAWSANLPVIGEKLLAKRIAQGIFTFGVIGSFLTLIKRPKHMLFFLFGFGNILFIGFVIGFGDYIKGYITRFWVDRFFNWPYLFTAILIIIGLFYYLPKLSQKLAPVFYVFSWGLVVLGLTVSQFIWKPINFFMQPVADIYNSEKRWSTEIASAYKGGTVLLPEDRPFITYFLVHDFGISGKNMEGQMFDPFFYFPDKENIFNNWGEDRIIILSWLKKDDIRLIALTTKKETYQGLIARESDIFQPIISKDNLYLQLYYVYPERINLSTLEKK
jgi:hypothetical protein